MNKVIDIVQTIIIDLIVLALIFCGIFAISSLEYLIDCLFNLF